METFRTPLRWILTSIMTVIGVLHFVADDAFAQIIPPFLPWPYALVWISGVFEIGLGVGLAFARTRRLSGWGLVALFVAVFPANLYMAIADVRVNGMEPLPAIYHWIRLPFQAVLIAWALWVSRPTRADTARAG
jgi:uncharacterized membrane protein